MNHIEEQKPVDPKFLPKTERGHARVENYDGKPEEFGLAKRTRRAKLAEEKGGK